MKKILVGLSGGVDSAVAAYLLKEQGYQVTAGFMKNYVDEENPNCSTYQDAKEAIKVAEFLGIEIISFDLRQEYEDKIIKYIYDGYKKGITPNPDILCNNLIKFDVFLEKALKLGFDGIAMGHYARIKSPLTPLSPGSVGTPFSLKKRREGGERNEKAPLFHGVPYQLRERGVSGDLERKKGQVGKFKLLRGVDYNKDQSYFLSGLTQYQLSKALFPIGDMTKNEVRELAKKIGLPNAERKDSQGLCFIGKIPMKEFLKKRLATKKGDIVLLNGTKVGEHEGAYFFTIGQSRGLDINKKAYVVKTDIKKNLVYVSYEKLEEELISKEIFVSNWHRIGEKYEFPLKCTTKIRYRQEVQNATIFKRDEEGKELRVEYEDAQRGIAPGQTLTAYIGDECIGNGVIV